MINMSSYKFFSGATISANNSVWDTVAYCVLSTLQTCRYLPPPPHPINSYGFWLLPAGWAEVRVRNHIVEQARWHMNLIFFHKCTVYTFLSLTSISFSSISLSSIYLSFTPLDLFWLAYISLVSIYLDSVTHSSNYFLSLCLASFSQSYIFFCFTVSFFYLSFSNVPFVHLSLFYFSCFCFSFFHLFFFLLSCLTLIFHTVTIS